MVRVIATTPFIPDDPPEAAPGASWAAPDLSVLHGKHQRAPAFPLATLGPFWSDFALRAADATCSPRDYVATALLSVAAGTIGNARWPSVGAAWAEPPVIWTGVVGDPSVAKSPPLALVRGLLSEIEDGMASGFDEVLRQHAAATRLANAAKAKWEAEADKAIAEHRDVPPMPSEAVAPVAPVKGRIVVMDGTTEALTALSAGLPRGYLLFRDELAGWFASFGRYGGGGTDRAFAIESYGGRRWDVNRVKHPNGIDVRHLTVGVLGAIQPDRVAEAVAGADDGLAARFLWSWPDQVPSFRICRDTLPTDAAKAALARLAALEMEEGEPRRISLHRDAEVILEAFGVEAQALAASAHGLLASASGKGRGHALRLACILEHIWWCARPDGRPPLAISPEATAAACDLMRAYFLPMARRVFGDAGAPVVERHAVRLAREIKKIGAPSFNARDMRYKIGGDLRPADAMAAAIRELEEAGLVRLSDQPKGRGRPAKLYDVNPKLLAE